MPTDDYANSPNMSRSEEIIQSILDGTEYDEPARSRIEYLLKELKDAIEEGGGGGGGSYTAGDGLNISGNVISAVPATTETIGSVIVGDGLDVDEEGVLSATDSRVYIAGNGIAISNAPFTLNTETVDNTEYLFNTQVTAKIGSRTYTKYNTEPALGAIIYGGSYSQPYFVGLTADSVKYGTDYDSHISPSPDHPSFVYKGVTWYYSGNDYGMSGDNVDSSGHMQKIPGTYSYATEADLQDIAKAIIDAANIVVDPAKSISAKLGEGLTFDSNNAIKVNGLSELQAKTVGMSAGGSNYITVGGIPFYVSSTAPTGNIPDGSVGVGW